MSKQLKAALAKEVSELTDVEKMLIAKHLEELSDEQKSKYADMVKSLEKHLGKSANVVHKPMQIGDVPYTYASIEHAREVLGYSPKTSFDEGVKHFVDWYVNTSTGTSVGAKAKV